MEVSLKNQLLKSGILRDTLGVLEQEYITTADIFQSLNREHLANLLPKMKVGQHVLLTKFLDTFQVKLVV